MSSDADEAAHTAVPLFVRQTAAWSWRLLVIAAALLALTWLLVELQLLVVSVAIAIILTALLLPLVDRLARRRVPRGVAVALVVLGSTALLGGALAFVINQFMSGLPALSGEVTRSIDSARDWLSNGPLEVSRAQIDQLGNDAIQAVRDNQDRLTAGALSTASLVTSLFTGAALVLFSVIFLLHGGREIWSFVTRVIPVSARVRVRGAGIAGFESLTGYVRATFLVALVDATGIGLGLAILGVPLALPLASLVFLGAFIPVVGAVATGMLAVIVALLSKGLIVAALTLAVVLAVQQLEGNVLQPLVMGRAVKLHPLAVLLVITAGAVLAGIVGALLSVPLLAFLNSATRHLLPGDEGPEDGEETEDEPEDDAEDAAVGAKGKPPEG